MTGYRKAIEQIRIKKDTIVDACAFGGTIDATNQPIEVRDRYIIAHFSDLMGLVHHIEDDVAIKMPFINRGIIGSCILDSEAFMIRSKNKGIITNIERHSLNKMYDLLTVETLSRYKVEIGTKICDRHSNKSTVSTILPNWKMPELKVPGSAKMLRVEAICPAHIGKRALPSREMEEITSWLSYRANCVYISMPTDNLHDIREKGTNKTPIVFNINPENEYSCMAFGIPCGMIAFAVLDQNPADKIKYSNHINTNYMGITERGLRNYNFTDGLFSIIPEGCKHLVDEIQTYAVESRNMEVLTRNSEALGFRVENSGIVILEEGIFKQNPSLTDKTVVIRKGYNKTDKDATIDDTIYDPQFEGKDILVRLPAGVPLFVAELVNGLGSKTTYQAHAHRFLVSDKTKSIMQEINLPFHHVYNLAKQDRYLLIPAYTIYTYHNHTGESFASAVMNRINSLIQLLNNTEKITLFKVPPAGYERQLIRCNYTFNSVVDYIIKSTVQKGGILRETLSPRIPYTVYAVAAGRADKPANEIYVPLRAVVNFAKKEEWRLIYGIPEDATPTDITNIINAAQHRVLVMRQPCHQRENISSFIFKVWNTNCIGIHNAVIEIMDGDHDGDCLFVYTPISKKGKKDLDKIKVEDVLKHIPIKKGMEGLEISNNSSEMLYNIHEITKLNTGVTEDIETSEHRDKYYSFSCIRRDYRECQANAADEFLYIKKGTANAGGIGNAARHIMYAKYGLIGLIVANRVYHHLAQGCLNSKHSTTAREYLDEVLRMFRSSCDPGAERFSNSLTRLTNDTEAVEMVLDFMYDNEQKWRGGITKISNEETPFARLLYRGNIVNVYKSATKQDEKSVATLLASQL